MAFLRLVCAEGMDVHGRTCLIVREEHSMYGRVRVGLDRRITMRCECMDVGVCVL